MIYMFTLIRMGKARIDRDKDWILYIYNVNTIGGIRKENSSIFFVVPVKMFSTTQRHVYIESGYMYKTVPFNSQYCFSHFSQSTSFYCYIRLYRHYTTYLCSPCGNSNPVRGTKFVTLPSFHITV